MKKKILLALSASALVVGAHAADKTKELATHTEMGYIQTNGNTKTKTFNLDSKAQREWGVHGLNFVFDGQYAKDRDTTTKKKFFTELGYDYAYTPRLAFSYIAGYKYDAFSGYDYQAYTGPGIKYKAIVQDTQHLTLEANALYSQDKIENPSETTSYAAYLARASYDLQINQNLKFTQDLSIRGSFEDGDNYFVYSKTALISKISDMFSAGISYKLDYANIPQAQYKTDETLTFNLIMDY